jgi:hypothetical protein
MKGDKDQTTNIQSENRQAKQSEELSEEELHSASGGFQACCKGTHIPKIVLHLS